MLDLGPVARHADADGTGVLAKSSLLELVDRADTIFATRAALVLPQPYNASLTTAASESGETPLQQLNKVGRQLLGTSPVSDWYLLGARSCRLAILSYTVATRRR
jgi:hypothetical protein